MNRSQLIDQISDQNSELKRGEIRTVLSSIEQAVQEALLNGESVELRGFGTFEPKLRAARTGRNPQTGEPIHIKEGYVPIFRPGTQLKGAVSGMKQIP